MSQNEGEEQEGIKIILVGETGTGKTSLINTAVGKKFNESEKSSVHCSYVKLKKEIDDMEYTIDLWDTIGQERFRSLTKVFFKNSEIVIFVFDITNKESFDDLDYWFKTIEDKLGNEIIKGLAANKQDLFENQEVDDDTIKQYAFKKGIKYEFTTAKNPDNFNKLLEQLLIEYLKTGISKERKKIVGKKLKKKKGGKKNKCC